MKITLPNLKIFQKGDADKINFKPHFVRDWKWMVGLFFVLVLTIFIVHFLLYWWLENFFLAQAQEESVKAGEKLLNHSAYENALSDIGDKEERFNEYLVSPPTLVDPSL